MLVPSLTLHRPTTLAEAVTLVRELPAFDFLGGGTDLLCNYKNSLNCKPHLISLTHVDELRGVSATRIGAATRLVELTDHAELEATYPVLGETARQIATPLIRETATVGGNLLVDTRCYWFNQTLDFRNALGSCLKAESQECRVVPNNSVCYATYSGDLGPVFMALQARIALLGPRGARTVTAHEFFIPRTGVAALAVPPVSGHDPSSSSAATGGGNGDGAHRMPDGLLLDGIGRNIKRPDELIVAVEFPADSRGLRAGYMKLRARNSMDFPDAGLAIALRRDAQGRLTALHLVANAVAPTPLSLDALGAPLLGTVPGELAIDALAERVEQTVTPHKNTHFTPKYRRKMLGVFTRRLMRRLLD